MFCFIFSNFHKFRHFLFEILYLFWTKILNFLKFLDIPYCELIMYKSDPQVG
jgi:hypothetical protein